MRSTERRASVLSLPVAAMLCVGGLYSPRADAQQDTQAGGALKRIVLAGRAERAKVLVEGDFKQPDYAIKARDKHRVIVLDIARASLPRKGVRALGESELVRGASASSTAQGIRIELRLAKSATYHARARRGRITLRLDAVEQSTGSRRSEAGGARTRAAAPAAGARSKPEPTTVRRLALVRRDCRERVVVELSRPAPFRVSAGEEGAARLELRGARVAHEAERSLTGNRYSVVRKVRLRQFDDRVVVEAERARGATATAIREGNRIVWLFAPPPDADKRALARPRVLAKKSGPTPLQIDAEQVASFQSDVPFQIIGSRGRGRYSGRRIDLDFKDADIHNILRLISEVASVNVVTSDEVRGSVTIRMRNVPWDQALDVILNAKGLGMVRRDNLIRVAPMAMLEKERELAIARRKQQIELAPLETRLVPVSYATAADLAARAKELLSERGKVSVDKRTNMLVARDIPESLDELEELVRSLDTQTPQVLIEARIVEATSQFERELGIQWGGDVTMTSATGNPTGLLFPNNLTVAGGATDEQTLSGGISPFVNSVPTPNFAINMPATTGTGRGGAIGLSLGSVAGNLNLNVRLSAAESSGVVRIISNPRILTLDNHQAHIAQGTSIPYSQLSAQGVQTAFREAKLELEVTPHVTSDGAIAMAAKITRDEPDFTRTSARGDPTILKREAETHLLVQDGHTAVIGGIFTRNTGRNVDQVPFFGDIPILGVLFQHRRMTDQRNELLIFLTPRIVNRAEALRR